MGDNMFSIFKDESPSVRFFSGGGGTPKPPPAPEKPVKQEEVRRVIETAGEARATERKRIPPGRKSVIGFGIESQLKKKLGPGG
jgi:hypothetical protein